MFDEISLRRLAVKIVFRRAVVTCGRVSGSSSVLSLSLFNGLLVVGRLRRGFGALQNKQIINAKINERRIEMTMSTNDKNQLAIDEFQNIISNLHIICNIFM